MFLVSFDAIEAASSLSEPLPDCRALSFSKAMLPTITIAQGLSQDRGVQTAGPVPAACRSRDQPLCNRTIRQLRGPNWPPVWR